MTVSEARAALPDVLDRVQAGDEVALTRHGRVVAIVVRPDRLRVRRADRVLQEAARLAEELGEASKTPLSASGSLTERRAEELLAELDRSRAAR